MLGELVAELERDWDLEVGLTLSGGSESYVAEATTGDGQSAVLKVALPGHDVSHEIATLRHADGRGYVRLLRGDETRQAMLVERLGTPLAALGLSVDRQLRIICSVLQCAWTAPPVPTFQTGAEKATWLASFIDATWRELAEPCPARVVERALELAEERRRAFDPDLAVLVHGDAHAVNTLRAAVEAGTGRAPFKLVDPDGLFAEPACDLAVPMREYSRELLAARDTVRATQERCAFLSRLTGVEAAPIWQWGFMERVSTGLLALRVGWEQVGADMLTVAEAIVSARGTTTATHIPVSRRRP